LILLKDDDDWRFKKPDKEAGPGKHEKGCGQGYG